MIRLVRKGHGQLSTLYSTFQCIFVSSVIMPLKPHNKAHTTDLSYLSVALDVICRQTATWKEKRELERKELMIRRWPATRRIQNQGLAVSYFYLCATNPQGCSGPCVFIVLEIALEAAFYQFCE